MPGKHTEAAFEAAVVADLVEHRSWAEGSPDDFDRQLALVPKDLFAFIEATQPELWADLRKQHRDGLEPSLLDTVVKMLESRSPPTRSSSTISSTSWTGGTSIWSPRLTPSARCSSSRRTSRRRMTRPT